MNGAMIGFAVVFTEEVLASCVARARVVRVMKAPASIGTATVAVPQSALKSVAGAHPHRPLVLLRIQNKDRTVTVPVALLWGGRVSDFAGARPL